MHKPKSLDRDEAYPHLPERSGMGELNSKRGLGQLSSVAGSHLPSEGRNMRPLVGVPLLGSSGFELFSACAEELACFDFFVYLPQETESAKSWFHRHGIRYTTDLEFFLFNIPSLDVALTFGALPHRSHTRVLLAVSLLRELGIPTIDIQHGLFQWGINFHEDSLKQGFGQDAGISLPIRTTADVQLTWNGTNAIGYPRFRSAAVPSSEQDEFILIATNSNWHIYTQEDRCLLSTTFRQLFDDMYQTRFVWKPHPAEFSRANTSLAALIDEIRNSPNKFRNVRLVPGGGARSSPLTELVGRCRAGIATLGTAVIDFEMNQRPCCVFDSPATRSFARSMPSADSFERYESLLAWLSNIDGKTRPPITGQLRPFEPAALNSHLLRAIDTRRSAPKAELRSCIPSIVRHTDLARRLTP